MHLVLLTRFHSQHQGLMGMMPLGQRLMEVALKMGHTLTIINPAEIVLEFGGTGGGQFPVLWKKQPFPEADLILPMARWDDTHTWQITETLLSWGRPVLAHQRVPLGDHVSMARLLARRNIPAPRSWVMNSPEQLEIMLTETTFPLLMRSRYGGKGRKVAVVQHTGEALAHARTLAGGGQPFLVQEMPEPLGEDIRLLVIGDQVVTALHRTAPAGFVRPKEADNPRVNEIAIRPEEQHIALEGAKLYGAPFCAVSLLRTAKGPMLIEVSRVPTLTEFETAAAKDFSGMIVQHLAEMAQRLKHAQAAGTIMPLRKPGSAV